MFFSKKQHDVVCIGDTTIDVFLRLIEAHEVKKEIGSEICMPFGEKIPYESLELIPAVGNASNVAVGCARLGFKVAMVAGVGDDDFGKQILSAYDKEGVDRSMVTITAKTPTNYHVVLNFGPERTILIKHNAFVYTPIKNIGKTSWIYLSSVAESAFNLHNEVVEYLIKNPGTRLAFNPGTFQIKLGTQKLKEVYAHTHILLVNREEAERMLETKDADIKKLCAGLHALGPKVIAITDGPNVAYASDGEQVYKTPPYPDPKPPFERTGAGDAFSTGFLAAYASGLSVQQALQWGPVESMSVVQYTGAQKGLLTRRQLLKLLQEAPASYRVSLL